MIGVGLLFAVGTGIAIMLFDYPFLTHFFDYFQFPIIGEVELTTALPLISVYTCCSWRCLNYYFSNCGG